MGPGARPFHIVISISQPQNPESPYQGTIEEWWSSPDQWRREITIKNGMRQTIVVTGGKKTEHDEGDYFPLWLRQFVMAAFDPIPLAAALSVSKSVIVQVTMLNGKKEKSDACTRGQFKIGSGERAPDAFVSMCFDGRGYLASYFSPGYGMEFQDYRPFGKKQIARKLIEDPEPGTELVGSVAVLEDLSKDVANLFVPLKGNEDKFRSIAVDPTQLEKLASDNQPIKWPAVHSGNLHGHLAVYISADNQGHVREAWPLNSDNAGLDDSVREQVRQWKLKRAVDSSGNPVQVDGALGFAFETRIEDPLPYLSDTEVHALAIKTVEPKWPAGSVKPGDAIEVEISVNEEGKLTGVSFKNIPNFLVGPINYALSQWTFHPFMRDGKAQYFHGTVKFSVP
jgi:hypothetical protein